MMSRATTSEAPVFFSNDVPVWLRKWKLRPHARLDPTLRRVPVSWIGKTFQKPTGIRPPRGAAPRPPETIDHGRSHSPHLKYFAPPRGGRFPS